MIMGRYESDQIDLFRISNSTQDWPEFMVAE